MKISRTLHPTSSRLRIRRARTRPLAAREVCTMGGHATTCPQGQEPPAEKTQASRPITITMAATSRAMSTVFLSRYRRVALNPTVRPLQLVLADELLDVDVLEGDHPYPGNEAGGPVHVPHPGVVEGDVEVGLAVLVAHLQVELVGEVEAALRLDDVLEHVQHVAVLLVELQLHVGLVALEVLGAHRPSSSSWLIVTAGWTGTAPGGTAHGAATPV